MSSRALRRLKGEQRAQAALNALKLTDEDDRDEKEHMKSDKTGHKQKNISNIFELVTSGMCDCHGAEVLPWYFDIYHGIYRTCVP